MTVPQAESVPVPPPLPWSTRLSLVPTTKKLHGDRIILPQSALEELLSAASAVENQRIQQPDYNPWDAAPPGDLFQDRGKLPKPVIVRLTNKDTGKSVYASPLEYSAEAGEVSLSPFLLSALGLSEDMATAGNLVLDVEAASLPKGTKIRVRPLEAGYDNEDWSSILESFLDPFATLSVDSVLEVPRGAGRKGSWRLLVDKTEPAESICVKEIDLLVDFEPLSEEQARETLVRQQQRRSAGGKLEVDQLVPGEVRAGEYHFYTLEKWNKERALVIELMDANANPGDDVDIFVTTDKQHHKPRVEEHIWGDLGSSYPKRISISPGNIELVDAKQISIGVRGWRDLELDKDGEEPSGEDYRRYTLYISQDEVLDATMSDAPQDEERSPNDKQCANCMHWIPQQQFMLHEARCYRTNVRCLHCSAVFQRGTEKDHWHCPSCTASGNTTASQSKHSAVAHTSVSCTSCPYIATSIPDLAAHRTSTCPGKVIICRFCNLKQEQEGEGDGSVPDAEVILSGLTRHEITCGGRTTECDICSRRFRLRDLDMHIQQHEWERLNKTIPKICKNPNCARTPSTGNGANRFDLCDTCFGPLYAPTYDPTGAALNKRVERKLLQQLLSGCGKSWCRNRMCKTGRQNAGLAKEGQVMGVKDILPMVQEVLKHSESGLELCVDEETQMRRALAEALQAESVVEGSEKGGYAVEWCVKAVQEGKGDASAARAWLAREAVRLKER